MSLPVDERLVTAQLNLMKDRDRLLTRKKELLSQFRKFALKKIKTNGQPFKIRYRAINGDEQMSYEEIELGQPFFLEYGSFTFEPKTGLLKDCERTELRAIKTSEDFDEFAKTTTSRPLVVRKLQQNIGIAAVIEREKIEKKMQKRVDKILTGIFTNKLSFDDLLAGINAASVDDSIATIADKAINL